MRTVHGLLAAAAATAACLGFQGARLAARADGDAKAKWKSLLQPPTIASSTLPADWNLAPRQAVEKPAPGTEGACGFGGKPLLSVDDLVRNSEVVVVGTAAGNDGSFYDPDTPRIQYTTYYLKVIGYLKDATGRRDPYLKVISIGGFKDGGQAWGRAPLPYLEDGKRYVLYLIRNKGFIWGVDGIRHPETKLIGRGDEYWVAGGGTGYWAEDHGQLRGFVAYREYFDGLGANRPLDQAIPRISQAVERERRNAPPLPVPEIIK